MTSTAPLEDLLRNALDRLTRQERRTEALEAAVIQYPPPVVPESRSSAETVPDIRWPVRTLPRAAAPAVDRVAELEARLAAAEERLRTASKLESIGLLVAGVAHDFNNLLTIISGNAESIRAELPAGHFLHESANQIVATVQTAAGVARQLLTSGQPTSPETSTLDPNAAIRTLQRTLGQLTRGRVGLAVMLAATTPLICVDPGQFDQVMLNLVVNARDAIPDAGTVTVRTAAVTIGSARGGWPADMPTGEFVAVTVTDNGTGMSDEVKARVFDPFFTTKGDRGTGLGLATVRDIVHAAGGHIEVESAIGWGTSVRVFWPVIGNAAGLRVVR